MPQRVDFTLAWRRLADAAAGDEAPLRALFADAQAPDAWLARWRARCASEGDSAQHAVGNGHRARQGDAQRQSHSSSRATIASRKRWPRHPDEGDLAPFERLLAALRQPYDEPELERLRRAGAGRSHGVLSHVLRHLRRPTDQGFRATRSISADIPVWRVPSCNTASYSRSASVSQPRNVCFTHSRVYRFSIAPGPPVPYWSCSGR